MSTQGGPDKGPDSWHDDYSLMPPRKPHVALVEREGLKALASVKPTFGERVLADFMELGNMTPEEARAALSDPLPHIRVAKRDPNEALTGALFTEAARRIVKQDTEAAALKKHRAKRKRLQKLAKKQRGRRG